jgi:hypothetical protein
MGLTVTFSDRRPHAPRGLRPLCRILSRVFHVSGRRGERRARDGHGPAGPIPRRRAERRLRASPRRKPS